MIIPFVDGLHRVPLRIVTMPIQSQGNGPSGLFEVVHGRAPARIVMTP